MGNKYRDPQSPNEAILQNILGEENELREPRSVTEYYLQEILKQGGGGPAIPTPTAEDNGKMLGVDNGAYALVEGDGMANPMTAQGDIIYANDNNGTPARLAKGTAGQVLTMNGQETAPIWQTLSVPLYRHDVSFNFEVDNVLCNAVVSFINTVSTPYASPRTFYLYFMNTFLRTNGDHYPINGFGEKTVDNTTYISTVHYMDRLATAIRFCGICNNERYYKIIDDSKILGTGFTDTVSAI